MPPFLRWFTDPLPGRGLYLAGDGQDWRRVEYPELARAAAAMAQRLEAEGVRPGDVVCLTVSSDLPSVAALLGAWLAGATVCPLATPVMQSAAEYAQRTAAILRQAGPVVTVTTASLLPVLAETGSAGRLVVAGETGAADPVPRRRGEIALLQFTSGSTARPHGVRVSWSNLEANLAAIRRGFGWCESDAVASWLPLYHDMGLIGCFYAALAVQADLWLMRPAQFIRDPARWLECFLPGRATLTAAPSFAFSYLARRVPADRIARMDLSGWRGIALGSEVIDVAALEAFARHAAPAKFSRAAFFPGYGLAENTLWVTSAGLDAKVRALRPDWARLRFGAAVQIEREGRYGDPGLKPGAGWLLGHGLPVIEDGIGVRIAGEDGEGLPDGYLGEIVVSGSSVAQGYVGGETGRSTRFAGRALHTGDAGFIYKGQLWVLGRMGESLSLRGRNVYVEELDGLVAQAARLGRDRVATVGMIRDGHTGVAVFAEARVGPWTVEVDRVLRGELGPEPPITIVVGNRGLIKRTTSGKPQRRRMWQLLQSGELAGASVITSGSKESQ
jgi:acyl-CoA synthetase (AMP-forming)/AMP-acid ligase II